MSDDQLKAFLEAFKADAGLQEQLRAQDPDAVVAIATAAGFAISAEDLKNAQANLRMKSLRAQLEAGVCPT
jgi:predicted ribosomally synthesized peptide with nif11-like leader